MRFRFKAFAWHLCGSATALTLTLGGLYLGWYHWPGWYLASMTNVSSSWSGSTWFSDPSLTLSSRTPQTTTRVRPRHRHDRRHAIGRLHYGVTVAVEGPSPLLCVLGELPADGPGQISSMTRRGGAPAKSRPRSPLVQPAAVDLGTTAE